MSQITFCTIVDHRYDFIPAQARCLKKFIADEHELIVFDNTSPENRELKYAIADCCKANGLRRVEVLEQRHDTPNYAHAQALDWVWQNVARKLESKFVVMLDFDLFPTASFSINEFMHGYSMAGRFQTRGHVRYLWPGLLVFRMAEIVDRENLSMYCDCIEGQNVDVGGRLYFYLKKYPSVRVRDVRSSGHISTNKAIEHLPENFVGSYDNDFHLEVLEDAFVHYVAGSNWNERAADYHQRKTHFVFDLLQKCVDGQSNMPIRSS